MTRISPKKTDRIGIIDIGTQSILYLLAEMNHSGLTAIHQETASVRLGKGLQENGAIQEFSCLKAVDVLNDYKRLALSEDVGKIITVGTRVFRSAKNSREIIRQIHDKTALDIEILSEQDEAKWSYFGAKYGKTVKEPSVVADIGGGSTEIVLGNRTRILKWTSLDLGAVILTEQSVHHDPPLNEEVTKIESAIQTKLDETAGELLTKGRCLIIVGGTATTLAALTLNLEVYEGDAVDGQILAQSELDEFTKRFCRMTVKEKKNLLHLDPARADIILAGTLILNRLLNRGNFKEIIISDHGLRHGIALREFQKHKNK
jgi:exopolyphosphatase/guanosine-5'-triphosphate,3'-diphosphate pyrophosphatase